MRQLPLYKILKVDPNTMNEVWILADQYPHLTRWWHPKARPEADLELLRLRYDASGEVRASLRAIGYQKGLTAERVRWRLNRIIIWLHEQIQGSRLHD